MEVIISGQAGAYAVLSKTAVLYDLSGRSFELSSGDLSGAFRGCTDVRTFKVRSKEEALKTCKGLRDSDQLCGSCCTCWMIVGKTDMR